MSKSLVQLDWGKQGSNFKSSTIKADTLVFGIRERLMLSIWWVLYFLVVLLCHRHDNLQRSLTELFRHLSHGPVSQVFPGVANHLSSCHHHRYLYRWPAELFRPLNHGTVSQVSPGRANHLSSCHRHHNLHRSPTELYRHLNRGQVSQVSPGVANYLSSIIIITICISHQHSSTGISIMGQSLRCLQV